MSSTAAPPAGHRQRRRRAHSRGHAAALREFAHPLLANLPIFQRSHRHPLAHRLARDTFGDGPRGRWSDRGVKSPRGQQARCGMPKVNQRNAEIKAE